MTRLALVDRGVKGTPARRSPLVGKGSPAAYALSLANRTAGIRAAFNRCRRRTLDVYGRDEAVLVLLLDRYEERLDALQTTADAIRDHLLLYAPAPRDDSPAWVCVNPACGKPLVGKRKDAETCSGACRAEVSRMRRAGLLPPRQPRQAPST